MQNSLHISPYLRKGKNTHLDIPHAQQDRSNTLQPQMA